VIHPMRNFSMRLRMNKLKILSCGSGSLMVREGGKKFPLFLF